MVAIVLDANYGVQTNHEEIWQTCEICSRLTPKQRQRLISYSYSILIDYLTLFYNWYKAK